MLLPRADGRDAEPRRGPRPHRPRRDASRPRRATGRPRLRGRAHRRRQAASTGSPCRAGHRDRWRHRAVETTNDHGTGCTYSAALAVHLALGVDLATRPRRRGLRRPRARHLRAPGSLGRGRGPDRPHCPHHHPQEETHMTRPPRPQRVAHRRRARACPSPASPSPTARPSTATATAGPGSRPRGRAARAARRAGSRSAATPRSTPAGEALLLDNGRSAVRRGRGARAVARRERRPRARAKAGRNVTQMHYARRGVVTAGDGVRRQPREGCDVELVAQRGRRRAGDHPGQRQPPRGRADDHRQAVPGEGQRQHRQLRGDQLDRRGGRQADLGGDLGRRHRHGPLHRRRHPHHPRVDRAQLAGPDRHRADLPGPGEGRRRRRDG